MVPISSLPGSWQRTTSPASSRRNPSNEPAVHSAKDVASGQHARVDVEHPDVGRAVIDVRSSADSARPLGWTKSSAATLTEPSDGSTR